MSELPTYIIDREFNAPRAMVWKAWTDPKLLARWYGPNVETIVHKFELKVGGEWHNEMIWGGSSKYQKVVFTEVDEPEKMVWHMHSSTDGNWNDAPNPMMADWPRLLLTTVVFEDHGGKTTVRLSQVPMDASAAEIACFEGAMANMDHGWGGGYTILDELFAEMQD